ncbi:MAG: 30S ribosomal protein S18 [Anaerolineae bacterium]|nr:30S ribosomal protein S18 [Anaerolineae bacterium]
MAEETTTGARAAAKAAPAGQRKRRTTAPRGRKTCAFCAEGAKAVDYKQVDVLRRYITERGQIRPRRKTTLCAKHQRRLALAIKRARFMALLPYTSEHIRIYGG